MLRRRLRQEPKVRPQNQSTGGGVNRSWRRPTQFQGIALNAEVCTLQPYSCERTASILALGLVGIPVASLVDSLCCRMRADLAMCRAVFVGLEPTALPQRILPLVEF
eukprot:6186513-Pleurochrysis_carterae.AAC.1